MSRGHRFFIPRADRLLGNRYALLECLGDGSYGWVWRSQRLEDNEIVAVKIPKEQGASSDELAEGAALMGQKRHPNVIGVNWMGRVPPEREWYVIEMEYFAGQTLAQLLEQGEQGFVASYERVLEIFQQVLAGVAHLHSLPMSHGDIKPHNILVSGGVAKLTDFGCSALPEEIYARSRENGGTLLYSAPEVAGRTSRMRSTEALFKADIYSLGVLLYHLGTTRLPHDTPSQVERHVPFPRPREINASICPALEDFTLRCLAFDPAERWASVREMETAFRRVRQHQIDYHPIRTLPPKLTPAEDWSSQTIRLLEARAYAQAERVAAAEFESSRDPNAFLLMVSAAYQDGRSFDCLRELEAQPEMLADESPVKADVRRIALATYLASRQIDKAEQMVELCLTGEGPMPDLLLKQASILGLQAQYEKAAEILLGLNSEYPRRPAILKRLALVYEQMRDTPRAAAFLRAYARLEPDDGWAVRRLEQYEALGVR